MPAAATVTKRQKTGDIVLVFVFGRALPITRSACISPYADKSLHKRPELAVEWDISSQILHSMSAPTSPRAAVVASADESAVAAVEEEIERALFEFENQSRAIKEALSALSLKMQESELNSQYTLAEQHMAHLDDLRTRCVLRSRPYICQILSHSIPAHHHPSRCQ